MMRWIAALFLAGTFASCSPSLERPDVPDDLISQDSMVVVMKELVVLESYIQNRFQRVDSYYKVMTASGKACLKRYHISPARFDRSYTWYVTEQDQLKVIYHRVKEELTRELNKLSPKPMTNSGGTLPQPAMMPKPE